MSYSRVETTADGSSSVVFPTPYNAAVDLVDRHVDEGRGDRIAYVHARGETSYRELRERVNRAGNALLRAGIRPEERVALVLLDGLDFVAVFLGAMKIGAVPVPMSTMLTEKDYEHLLSDSRASLCVVSTPLLDRVLPAARRSRWLRETWHARPLAELDPESERALAAHLSRGPLPELATHLAAADTHLEAEPTSADHVAFWLYSSGSTGLPKGAMHLHGHLARTAVSYARSVLGLGPDDRVYSTARLFFAYGLGNTLTFPLYAGATAVLEEARPSPDTVRAVFERHAPTVFCGVPTLLAQLLAKGAVNRDVATRLRLSTSAGEALPAHLGHRWRERTGTDILDGIGSTEMLHIFVSNRPDDVRYGTSGTAVPGYSLKLVTDDGLEAKAGEEGALWVRGRTAAIGYFGQREKSLATFHGPWTRTGDRYFLREDGAYVYAGRDDDMLKVGGIWVSPFEVESALASHEAVLEAAVVGAEDPTGLVKPKAFVVLAPGHEGTDELEIALKAHVRDLLAPYKYPRWLVFVTELPKTATGKVQRYRLRESST